MRRVTMRGMTGKQGRPQPAGRGERGQAMVLIALALFGLLAFIGLMVDAGLLFIGVGHLRRAVDAAALAAAAQFREGRTLADQTAAAREVIHLNGVAPSDLKLLICDPGQSWNMDALCPEDGSPQRKLIYIQAKSKVEFAFLTIIGFHSTEIVADATSEAASVDVVLVIDTSSSMSEDGETEDLKNPATCNITDAAGADGFPGECHPFEEVKQAAASFVQGLYFPYDRVSIVTYDIGGTLVLPLSNSLNVTETVELISELEVSPRRNSGDPVECVLSFASEYPPPPPTFDASPSGCPNTSIGGGLKLAGDEFGKPPIRQESVWVTILLTDGAANASEPDTDGDPINKFCPPTFYDGDGDPFWQQPFCRDAETGNAFTIAHTRHVMINPAVWGRTEPYNTYGTYDVALVDADDYAAAQADFVACAPIQSQAAEWCRDSLDYTDGEGGQGALIYAIGLGPLVTCIGSIVSDVCIDRDPSEWTQGRPDAGDRLLRYIANVGIDGDPNPNPGSGGVGITDPCLGVAVPYPLTSGNDSYNCGNYYFAEFGTGLASVFESIASRIFTRLTQ